MSASTTSRLSSSSFSYNHHILLRVLASSDPDQNTPGRSHAACGLSLTLSLVHSPTNFNPDANPTTWVDVYLAKQPCPATVDGKHGAHDDVAGYHDEWAACGEHRQLTAVLLQQAVRSGKGECPFCFELCTLSCAECAPNSSRLAIPCMCRSSLIVSSPSPRCL